MHNTHSLQKYLICGDEFSSNQGEQQLEFPLWQTQFTPCTSASKTVWRAGLGLGKPWCQQVVCSVEGGHGRGSAQHLLQQDPGFGDDL